MPHLKFIVAGAFILGAISYLMFSGIDESMVYYYTVSEFLDKEGEIAARGVRVNGHVSPGTISTDTTKSRVEFVMFEKETDRTLPVVYQGIIPDTFKDSSEVVVEGSYRPEKNVFEANVLLAKCPSKYEALGDEHPEDVPRY